MVVLAGCAVLVGVAAAGKTGNGSPTGTGSVFVPNPVQSLGDESLTDQKDSDAAVPAAAYHTVTLTNLDGSGFLRGDYADVYSSTGDLAFSPTNTFTYTRHQDEFEQVMVYYWFTEAPKDELRFGKGGVDDAEDGEVILHEYGHALHAAQNFNFDPEQNGAISEGFADYWAVTVTDVVSQRLGVPELEPLPCVADWDSVSYTSTVPHCLRRVDRNLHYPADLNGEVHHDGQIWSRALWDIRRSLGHTVADTIILKAQIDFPGTTMIDLANRTVAPAQQLYGMSAAKPVTKAIEARGIL